MQSMKEQMVSEMREVRSEVTGEVQEGEGQKWMMIGEGGKEGGRGGGQGKGMLRIKSRSFSMTYTCLLR